MGRQLVFADLAVELEFLGDVSAGDRSPFWLSLSHGNGHEQAGEVFHRSYFYAAELPMLIDLVRFALDDFFAERQRQGFRDRFAGDAWPLGDAHWVYSGAPGSSVEADPERLSRMMEQVRVWSLALAEMSSQMADLASADGGRVR